MRLEKFHTGRARTTAGFTLVEVMVATSLSLAAAAAAYTLLIATVKLYAENFSLNHSHQTARLPLERMIREINAAGCPPIFVDDKGADTTGVDQGGVRCAPGVRFGTLASTAPYTVTSSAAAGAKSVRIRVNPGQPMPRESDILLIHASEITKFGNGIQVEIAGVTGTSPFTVTLKTGLDVKVDSGSSALILQQSAFIAVGGQLRYYNKVMSEARHGAAAFNDPDNFRALAQLEPTPGQPQARPFSYATAEERLLRVDLRARATKYSSLDARYSKARSFNTFLNMQSSIAVKSVYLDPTKLGAIK